METPPEPDLPPKAVMRGRQLGQPTPDRHWTPVGTIDGGSVADVDPAGLVRRRDAAWSLDWWVGAEDRWHHPSVEASVRQELRDDCPVVVTALRVPGGDVTQTVYGVRATAPQWNDDAVVVDIVNDTSVPVALAVVLRPLTPDGAGELSDVRVDGPTLSVGGRVAAVLSRSVSRVAFGDGAGSAAARLRAGEDVEPGQGGFEAPRGRDLEVACVVPLPHSAMVRVLLPAPPPPPRRRVAHAGPSADWQSPESDAVVAGWQAHSRRVATVETPELLHGRVVAAGARVLALAAGDGLHDGDGELTVATRAAQLAELLVRAGIDEPLEPLLAALLEGRALGGAIRLGDRSDATVALVHVAGALLDRAESGDAAEELLALVDAALRRIERRTDTRPDESLERSAGVAAAHLVAPLARLGQPELAAAARELADAMTISGSSTVADATDVSSLVARALVVRSTLASGSGVEAMSLLAPLVRLGSPAVVGDRVDGGGYSVGARGFDAPAVAARMAAVLDASVLETADGATLGAGWTQGWYGAPCEVHGLRTSFGELSFALRWHGTRPALLWEVLPRDGADRDRPPVLRAPVLDPSWSSSGWQGEALLAEVAPPESAVSLRGAVGADPAADPDLSGRLQPESGEVPGEPPTEGSSFN